MIFQRKFVRIEGSARICVDRGGQCGLFSSHGSEGTMFYAVDKNNRVLDWDKNRENIEDLVHQVRNDASVKPVQIFEAPAGQYSGDTFEKGGK